MNHQSFIQLFRESADEAIGTPGYFIRGRRPDASLASIVKDNPIIVLLPFRETKDYVKKNISRQVTMLFLKQDSPGNQKAIDSKDEEMDLRDGIVSEMYGLLDLFIAALNTRLDSPTSEFYGKGSFGQVLSTPEYGILAGYFTGYGASFTFNSKMVC